MLFEVTTASQSNIFSKSTKIGSFSVSIEGHKTFRSVILVSDLLHSTKEELLGNFKKENVIDVDWFTICRNDQIFPTKHIILAFNSPNLPNKIKAAYFSCPVRLYISNPLQYAFNASIVDIVKFHLKVPLPVPTVQKLNVTTKHMRNLNAALTAKEITQLIQELVLNRYLKKRSKLLK